MKLFFERLRYTFYIITSNESVRDLLSMIAFILAMMILVSITFIPIFLLYPYLGIYSVLWFAFLILTCYAIEYRIALKEWFVWQFIEPFNKNGDK